MTQLLSRVETKKLARQMKSKSKKKKIFGTLVVASVAASLSSTANDFNKAEAKERDTAIIQEDIASSKESSESLKLHKLHKETPVSTTEQTNSSKVETAVNQEVQKNPVAKVERSLHTNPEQTATKSVNEVTPAVVTEVDEEKAEEKLVVEPKKETSTESAKVEKKSVVASVNKPKVTVSVSETPVTDVKAENTTDNEPKVEVSEKEPTTNVVVKEETKSENEVAKQSTQTLNTSSETSSEQAPVYGPPKETEGSVTGVIGNTISVDVEGEIMEFSTNGDAKLQREISEFTPGTGIVVRYVESTEGQKIIKDLIKVYDEKKGDLTVYITCDFYGMVGPYTVTVYENHKATSYQISEDLFGRDFEKEFAPGTKVSLAAVKTDDGIIVENISEL